MNLCPRLATHWFWQTCGLVSKEGHRDPPNKWAEGYPLKHTASHTVHGQNSCTTFETMVETITFVGYFTGEPTLFPPARCPFSPLLLGFWVPLLK